MYQFSRPAVECGRNTWGGMHDVRDAPRSFEKPSWLSDSIGENMAHVRYFLDYYRKASPQGAVRGASGVGVSLGTEGGQGVHSQVEI